MCCTRNSLLLDAVSANDTIEVMRLLSLPPRRPWRPWITAGECNVALCTAATHGYASIVVILLRDPRVNPAAYDNLAIQLAAQDGNYSVVTLLLQDPRVNPAARGNYAIQVAELNGHTSIVKLLLQERRVTPAVIN